MNTGRVVLAVLLIVLVIPSAYAQIFGTVRGTILDPQGAAVSGAKVTLKAHASAFRKMTQSDEAGNFTFPAVPAESYTVGVEMPGFETQSQPVTVAILGAPTLRVSLEMAGVETNVSVIEEIAPLNQDASSPPVTMEESDILHTPGS